MCRSTSHGIGLIIHIEHEPVVPTCSWICLECSALCVTGLEMTQGSNRMEIYFQGWIQAGIQGQSFQILFFLMLSDTLLWSTKCQWLIIVSNFMRGIKSLRRVYREFQICNVLSQNACLPVPNRKWIIEPFLVLQWRGSKESYFLCVIFFSFIGRHLQHLL